MATDLRTKLSLVWQFIKLALISGIVFIFIIVVALSVLTYIYRDDIKDAFVEELLQNLKSETSIDEVSVNLFRSFPKASVTLNNVVMLEAIDKAPKDTLLNARRIYFQFSIMDLIKKKYKIKKLEVVLADFNPVVFKDKSVNYNVWESSGESTNKDFVFDFEKVSLKRVNINFRDDDRKNKLLFMANEAELSGHFGSKNYMLNIDGDFFAESVIVDNTEFLSNHNLNINTVLDVTDNSLFVLKGGKIAVNSHQFDLAGEVDMRQKDLFLDINIASDKLSLNDLLLDFPRSVSSYFDGYNIKGYLDFKANISGVYSGIINPLVKAEFTLSDATIKHASTGVQMKHLSFSGKFNNGNYRKLSSSVIALTNITSELNNGFLEGDFHLHNFNTPTIDMNIKSDIELFDLVHFLKFENVENPKGYLSLNLDFIGTLSDGKQFKPHDFLASSVLGKVNFDNISFSLKDDPKNYNNLSGNLMFNNNDLIIKSFDGNVSSSDFHVVGYLRNFLSYLFFDNQKLAVNASFKSEHLNFNELLQQNVAGSDTTYRLRFSDRLNFTLEADIKNIVFHNFKATDVKGSAYLRNQIFIAEDIGFNSMDGAVHVAGAIDGTNADILKVNCMANAENVQIQQLFFQLNNFGQEAIEDKHLRGKLNSDVKFAANWSPNLDVDLNSIVADANLKIENGELIDYEPILELSRFLEIGDLKHINFSTLENSINIKNQTIFIPFMDINSSAIDLKISGEHYFNNAIDYRLQVALSDVLASRSRQNRNPQEKYGEIIDDGESRTLFLLVTGTIDDPIFKYDTKSAIKKFRDDLRKERENLKEVFIKEFGISPKDTIDEFTTEEEKEKIKERKEIKKGEEGEFIIEWD